MSSNVLKVAVVSDLHFVHTDHVQNSDNHSWLTFNTDGSLNSSFWENLLAKIRTDNVNADILVCPGDITTNAEPEALKFAWEKLNLLAAELGCKILATATGNHDVTSRLAEIANPIRDLDKDGSLVEHLKLLSPNYPLVNLIESDEEKAHYQRVHYFGSNFLVHDEHDKYRLIVLNSCGSHTSAQADYERGFVSESTRVWLDEYLVNLKSKQNKKLGILVCHHHPILHPDHDLGTYDFMSGGSQLLDMLNEHGNWIIIHGHKHHAKITYHMSGSKKSVVFAAGTLAAHKKSLGTHFANQFYIMNVELDKQKGTPQGTLDVYSWQANSWSLSKRTNDGIYTGVGFGEIGCLEDLADKIASSLPPLGKEDWHNIVKQHNCMKYCVPQDLKFLESHLRERHIDIIKSADSEIEFLERSKGE